MLPVGLPPELIQAMVPLVLVPARQTTMFQPSALLGKVEFEKVCGALETVVKLQTVRWQVLVQVDVLDATGSERARSPNQSMHLVTFPEQQLRQVRSVLARDAGD